MKISKKNKEVILGILIFLPFLLMIILLELGEFLTGCAESLDKKITKWGSFILEKLEYEA